MKWLLLAGAIVTEVAGTLSLRGAINNAALYPVVVIGYVASFFLLAATLKQGMPVSIAYAIWAALGVACTAGLAVVFFGERITPVMGLGLVLIIAGVVVVELGS